jgi:DNA polymerase-3 subunit delta'
MQFNDIVGQEQIKQKLIQTVKNNRISHAQLFLGPEGSGSLALALAYAQYINCPNKTDDDSCGICPSCVQHSKLIHPDLHFTFPTINVDKKKTSNEFIEDWRKAFTNNAYITELEWLLTLDDEGKKQGNITAEECRDIVRKIGLKAFSASYKTVIVWLPEYMGYEGNILLKLLEEPPPNTLILLVAQDAEKLLATILSRTQMVKIPRLPDERVASDLMNRLQLPQHIAEPIARVAEGNLASAWQLAAEGRGNYNELFADWMRACYFRDMQKIEKSVGDITGTGKEFIKSFVHYSLHMMRAVMLSSHAHQRMIKLSEQETVFIQKFSRMFNERSVFDINAALNKLAFAIERNADVRTAFYQLSFYISRRMVHQTTH